MKIFKFKKTFLAILMLILISGFFNINFSQAFLPNDPYYLNEQWQLAKIRVSQAWDLTQGSDKVVVALIDSGVDIDHEDLKNNIWTNSKEIAGNYKDDDNNGFVDDVNGWDFVNNNNDPRPKIGGLYNEGGVNHGTVVAGVIAAETNNSLGLAGVAYKAQIMPLRALNSLGIGDTTDVIEAIDYAIQNGADIINMSFVGHNYSQGLQDAIQRAWDAGLVIVAASGNDTAEVGENLNKQPSYPVCSDTIEENIVIGVSAVDHNNQKADFSNYGSKCVDISAPGTRFYATQYTNPAYQDFQKAYDGYWTGTSLATPLVSGTVALMKAVNPQISNVQIRDIILSTATNIDQWNSKYKNGELGTGLLNTYQAVKEVYTNFVNQPVAEYIVTAPGAGGGPQVKLFKSNGYLVSSFMAYQENFKGGVNIATGDVNGDGQEEIVTGAGVGGGPHVKIFNQQGELLGHFMAFDETHRNGVKVAVGNVYGDAQAEIITAEMKNSSPLIRIYTSNGHLISQWYAFDQNFKGGVSLSTGDVDGSYLEEIMVGAGVGGGPQVRIFTWQGNVKNQFMAFLETFRGGINVVSGDLDGSGFDEIVSSVFSGVGPYIRVFDKQANLRSQFLGFNENFLGGVNLAQVDLNSDDQAEIIIGAGAGGGPQVRIFDMQGNVKSQFFAYDQNFKGGVNVASLKNN
ncbi:MAG: S8 family peptidase [Patescibacteria group bacterium]|nr:S8 family peptidase [Patescibacteria group bacterium]